MPEQKGWPGQKEPLTRKKPPYAETHAKASGSITLSGHPASAQSCKNDLNLSDGEAESEDVDKLFDNLDRSTDFNELNEQVPAVVSVDVRSSTEITLDT